MYHQRTCMEAWKEVNVYIGTQIPQALLTSLGLQKRETIYHLEEDLSFLRRDFEYVHVFSSSACLIIDWN